MAPEGLELSIVLAGDKHIAALNRTHRNLDKPTDVLSFPLEEHLAGPLAGDARAPYARHRAALQKALAAARRLEGGAPLALGDVVIGVNVAKAQAKELGETLAEAYARLLAHGIAHLLGYDHERGERWEKAMSTVEAGFRKAAMK